MNTITTKYLTGVGFVGNHWAHTGGTTVQPHRCTRNPCPSNPWGGGYGQQVTLFDSGKYHVLIGGKNFNLN